MTIGGPPPDLSGWDAEGDPEPNPPPGHPLAGIPERLVQPQFKIEVGRPLAPFAPPLLHEATMEQINAELARRSPPGELRGLLANVPIEAINAELSRRFQGVALIALGASTGGLSDMYYTSVRGVPMPALAGCVQKLANDLHASAKLVDIKPT